MTLLNVGPPAGEAPKGTGALVREQAVKFASPVALGVWGLLLWLGNEVVFLTLTVAVTGIAAGVAVWGDRWVRESPLTDGRGNPFARAVLPRWSKLVAWAVAVLTPAAAAAVWFGLWTVLVPLARIDAVVGSELAGGSGEQFVKHGAASVQTADGATHPVFLALQVNVSRVGTGTIKIKSVDLAITPFPVVGVQTEHAGAYLDKLRLANRFWAEIPPAGGNAPCQLTDGENPVLGVVLLNADSPEAILHVQAIGPQNGIYLATVRVTVSDEGDRRVRHLTSDKPVLLRVYEPSREPERPPQAAPSSPKTVPGR